jgi:hypothetical protein
LLQISKEKEEEKETSTLQADTIESLQYFVKDDNLDLQIEAMKILVRLGDKNIFTWNSKR